MSADVSPHAEIVTSGPGVGGLAVRSGAELVELSERFYRGMFVGVIVFVGFASLAALALLPLRDSVKADGPPPTALLAGLLAVATPLAVLRAAAIYRLLRSDPRWELVLVAIATTLIVYPLRSELWWPSCALLMVIATIAPLRRTFAYCLVVLIANLLAHVMAGDLTDTPAVSIIGLWIGFFFWTATFGVIGNQLTAHILRLRMPPAPPPPARPLRVREAVAPARPHAEPETVSADPPATMAVAPSAPIGGPHTATDVGAESRMARLTARQLQVVVLLADGLRYRDIAACLAISERQVHRHAGNAIERASVRNVVELVAVAVAEGLVPEPGEAAATASD